MCQDPVCTPALSPRSACLIWRPHQLCCCCAALKRGVWGTATRSLHQACLPSPWSSLPELCCRHAHAWWCMCMLLIITHWPEFLAWLWTYPISMGLPSDCWTLADPGCCHQTCPALLAWPSQWVLAGKGTAPAAWWHPQFQLPSPCRAAHSWHTALQLFSVNL